MALGGDRPDDVFGANSEFDYAIDLVELTREMGDFSIGVAAHPNGHPRSGDLRSDRRFLAEKLEVADFAVTQFFFESRDWTHLVEELAELGTTKPVLPGIMPVTHALGHRPDARNGRRGCPTRWCNGSNARMSAAARPRCGPRESVGRSRNVKS